MDDIPDAALTPSNFPPRASANLPAKEPAQPTWRRWMWLALLLVFLGFAYWYDQSTQFSEQKETTNPITGEASPGATDTSLPTSSPSNGSTLPTSQASAPAKTVVEAGAFKLVADSAGTCTVDRPEGWQKPVTSEGSKTLDVFSPDKAMYAGYGIQAVNTQLAQYASYYPAPLNDPDLYSEEPATVSFAYAKAVMAGLGGSQNLSPTSDYNETIGEYSLRSFVTSTHTGVVFFHSTGFPGDGYNYSYVLPMYFAVTTNALWDQYGLMVSKVAASIDCRVIPFPRNSGPEIGSSSSSSSSDDSNGNDAGYNPQLGTEEVHDPTTGENYVVDPSQHWSETGPNGGGYYIPKSGGNDYTQLEPGRSD